MARFTHSQTSLILAIYTFSNGALAQTSATFDPGRPYPGEVALVDEPGKGYVFRRFPSGGRLYTYDLDTPSQSACNKGCQGARQPVWAPPGAKQVGDWTVIRRYDGRGQWAYKGRPVYTLFHDTAEGFGGSDVWHPLPYEK